MDDDDGLAHDDPLLRSDAGGAAMPQSPTPQAVIAKMAEMEVDADSHEAAIDAELRGIAAAAAGEIDAFLAEAQKQVTPVGGARTIGRRSVRSSAELRASNSDADAQNAEDERRVRATLTHYDGAKRALKTLSARMEQVQRELEALEDDDRGVRDEMDGTIEPDAGAVAMGAVDDEVMRSVPRRRRLEREASEYAEEIARRTEELERLDVEVYNARRELIEAETNVVFVDEIRGEVADREASNLVSDAVKVADISRTDAEALRRYEAARHAAYTRERTRKAIYKERERFVVEAGRASRREIERGPRAPRGGGVARRRAAFERHQALTRAQALHGQGVRARDQVRRGQGELPRAAKGGQATGSGRVARQRSQSVSGVPGAGRGVAGARHRTPQRQKPRDAHGTDPHASVQGGKRDGAAQG
jgi:hypothetical protein